MQIPLIIVDSSSPITINAQIASQVKLSIAMGELKPGETLPTVVELAKHLEVNHNTVAAVYNELTESGYLVAQRGKGTFVADTQTVQKLITHQQFYSLLGQAFTAAVAVGLDPSSFTSAAYAQAMRFSRNKATSLKLVFVAPSSYNVELDEAIQADVGQPLSFMRLEYLAARQPEALKKLRAADLIITTGQYLWEVISVAAPEQEVIAIDVKPELQLLAQVSSYPRHAKLLLVGQEKADSEAMEKMLKQAGISHLNFQPIGLKSLKQNRQLLERVDGICASKSVSDYVRQQLSQPEKVVVFNLSLEPTNMLVLKARLAAILSSTLPIRQHSISS